MKDVRTIKQLKTALAGEELAFAQINQRMRSYQSEQDKTRSHIDRLKEMIAHFDADKKLRVSEHAMLRYLERAKGINIEALEAEILTEGIRKLVGVLGGNGEYPHESGHSLKMKNYTVTTVV